MRSLTRLAAASTFALTAALLPSTAASAVTVDHIVAPTSGATVSGTVTISVSADEDPSCGSGFGVLVDFGLDGVSFDQAMTTPEANGYYEMGWDTTLNSKGAHTLNATVTDSCNNQVFLSEPITIDNGNPPTIALTAPTNGSSASGAVTVTATASQGSSATISQVDFYDGSTLIDSDYTAPWSATWDSAQEPDGAHMLHATATDSNNQVGVSPTVQVTVTNPHPTVTITSPVASSGTLHDTVQISASASGTSPISYVRLFVDGYALVTLSTAPYTYSWDTTFEADGQHTLTADAYTSSGQKGTSPGVVVTTNNTDPIATLASPASGSSISGSAVTLSATSSAPQSCANPRPAVQFILDGTARSTVAVPAQNGYYETPLDTTGLTDGTHQLQVRATCDDGYSWGPTSAASSVTVSNVTPAVAVTSPAAGAEISGRTVAYQVGVSPHGSATISKVDFYLDSTLLGTDMTAPYGVTIDTTASKLGAHTLTARATDSSNQVGEKAETVYVVAPTTLTLSVPTRTLTVPAAETLSATLRAPQPSPGGVLAGRSISLLRRPHGTTAWTVASSATSNSNGVVAFRVAPDRNTDYAARYVGATHTYRPSLSAAITVAVHPHVALTAASTRVPLGKYVTLSAAVGPNLAGRTVYLQRWTGSSWVNISSRVLDRNSHATWSFRPSSRGYRTYRVYRPADSARLSGVSSQVTVRVY